MPVNPIAAALLAVACIQDPPSLLPETPEGWRYERLDFPLSFAPDIELKGFEELRFAPGMFDPASPSYFSYVMAIRVEDDIDVDDAFVQDFLTKYYHGLCAAVGESRSLDLDLSRIGVQLEPKGHRYDATVEMYDPFVTGKPLTLRFELDTHVGADGVELFGAVSPAAKDSPIWDEMHAIADGWLMARPVPVFLNHVFVIPDRATYDALATSDVLRELAVFEERETVRGDMSYSGIYFYGRRTYFEFLPPGSSLPEGATGLAFGVERVDGTDALAGSLEARGIQPFQGRITRRAGDEDLPWFRIMGVEKAHPESMLSVFTMEYEPQFLARWHPDLPPKPADRTGPGITRRDVLQRYAAKIGGGPRPMADVTAVELALDERQRARFVETCAAFGYAVDEKDGTWTCTGPQFRTLVRASESPGGVVAFHLSLRDEVAPRTTELGSAKLILDGRTAVLRFE